MRDIKAAFGRRVTRKNIFIRLLVSLHASRRREAQRVLRRYDHLIERHSQIATSLAPDAPPTEEGHQNAHGNKSPLRADDRSDRNTAIRSIRNQYA